MDESHSGSQGGHSSKPPWSCPAVFDRGPTCGTTSTRSPLMGVYRSTGIGHSKIHHDPHPKIRQHRARCRYGCAISRHPSATRAPRASSARSAASPLAPKSGTCPHGSSPTGPTAAVAAVQRSMGAPALRPMAAPRQSAAHRRRAGSGTASTRASTLRRAPPAPASGGSRRASRAGPQRPNLTAQMKITPIRSRCARQGGRRSPRCAPTRASADPGQTPAPH